jgi:CHAD domain-containing protein
MARATGETPTVSRSKRAVALRTSKGTRRVALPRPKAPRRVKQRQVAAGPLDVLTESLEGRWKKFRRRLRRGIPVGNRKKIDESVHDIRTSARRLLAVLAALGPFLEGKAARRLSRRVDSVLDRSGALRDLGVQLDMLPKVRSSSSGPALRRLKKQLGRKHDRRARKLHRRLSREDVGRLRDDVRRLLKRSCRAKATLKASATDRAALQPGRQAFARLHESRLAVNPTALDTIHRMRIALKEFRYLMEAIGPLAPGVGEEELESLHKLQTSMGDLHDLEILSSTIARHVETQAPESAAKLAPVLGKLEVRHSAMLSSFLKAVDPILDSWGRLLQHSAAGGKNAR